MTILLMVAALAAAANPQVAAPPVQDTGKLAEQAAALGQCFVDKTTGADRIAVARWMLGSMSSAPQMADLIKVDSALKTEADKKMAALFTRLMAVDCASEARPLFKARSRAGFEAAGGALGKIAMKELLTDPAASKGLENYTSYLRESDFAGLVK